jgi:hypothetical protein
LVYPTNGNTAWLCWYWIHMTVHPQKSLSFVNKFCLGKPPKRISHWPISIQGLLILVPKLQPQYLCTSDKPSKAEANPNTTNYCTLHQTNEKHANESKVLLSQIKRMEYAYDTGQACNVPSARKKIFKNMKQNKCVIFHAKCFLNEQPTDCSSW